MTVFTKTLPILSEIQAITNSVILRYPETVAISDSKDILMRIDFAGLGEEEFPQIPLMESLSSFTNLLGLFSDERKVTFEGSEIYVSEGSLKSSFITDNVALMEDFDKDPIQFDRTREVPDVAIFDLVVDDIKTIRQASGVFKDLTDIVIACKDGDVSVSLGATSKFNARSNTFSKMYDGKGSKDFEIAIPVDNFKSIPLSDYTFMVKYHSARDSYRIFLECATMDSNLEIIMTVKL